MGLNAKKAGGNKNRVEQALIEPDVYPAYLVQVLDLGLQAQRPYQGKDKPPVQEVMLTYELSDCFMQDEDGNDLEDKPRWVSETLPFYGLFADKAKSTKRYYALDPKEEFQGQFGELVGMPCNVTIVHNEGKDNKTYINVGDVASISAKKAEKMEPIKNPTKVFDLEEPDMEVFNALPEWIQTKIKSNLNYQGSPLQAALEKGGKQEAKKEEAKPAPKKRAADPDDEDEDDSNNPY